MVVFLWVEELVRCAPAVPPCAFDAYLRRANVQVTGAPVGIPAPATLSVGYLRSGLPLTGCP